MQCDWDTNVCLQLKNALNREWTSIAIFGYNTTIFGLSFLSIFLKNCSSGNCQKPWNQRSVRSTKFLFTNKDSLQNGSLNLGRGRQMKITHICNKSKAKHNSTKSPLADRNWIFCAYCRFFHFCSRTSINNKTSQSHLLKSQEPNDADAIAIQRVSYASCFGGEATSGHFRFNMFWVECGKLTVTRNQNGKLNCSSCKSPNRIPIAIGQVPKGFRWYLAA